MCDFLYFCSMAEAHKRAEREEEQARGGGALGVPCRRRTPVIFVHCCPHNDPYSTADVASTLKEIVLWVCARL